MNRVESALRTSETTIENLSASRSRIVDADYAKETAALTRTQILAQAGTAMQAQAQATSNLALSLLNNSLF
jgi:flagellin